MTAHRLDRTARQQLLEREQPLIEAARPYMLTLSGAAGAHRHAAMLGDRSGRILAVLGDDASVQGPEAVPGAGALLDEASGGANGIGTALAHGAYVELIGPEHYIQGFHPFTCQGIPLRDAFGAVVGVLSLSVRRLEVANRVRDMLFCTAEGLECQLIHQWLLAQVGAMGVERVRWADNLRQDLLQRFTAARLELEVAGREIARGQSTDEVVEKIRREMATFRRLAETWLDLVVQRDWREEELRLDDITANVFELFSTESRFARVQLDLAEAGPARVLDDRTRLTRRVLGRLLDAMQAAGAGGLVRAHVSTAGPGSAALLLLQASDSDGADVGSFAVSVPTRT